MRTLLIVFLFATPLRGQDAAAIRAARSAQNAAMAKGDVEHAAGARGRR